MHCSNFYGYSINGRSIGRALRCLQRQRNFTDEPLVAPIKMRLTPELANYIFDNARAESAVRGPGDGRPARFNPAQTEPPACGTRPGDVNATIAADREPYFAALVASSCKEIVIA
jgi:hypothetical protein